MKLSDKNEFIKRFNNIHKDIKDQENIVVDTFLNTPSDITDSEIDFINNTIW